ncbi:MAG: DMT family transporter [Candidatus Rokubacteria bacterium]|nr:DMT family transporter [Candidatus Rokubacteria bacterium]
MSSLRALDARGAFLALLLAALWGANPVVIKLGLDAAPPLRLAWMRFVIGGLVILLYAVLTGRHGVLTVRPGEAGPIWSLGLLFALQIGLMNVGIGLTTAGHAAILLNSYAVHAVVLAHVFIPGDRLTPGKISGVLVAYAGIVLLFARDFSFGSATLVGDLVVAVSAFLLGERIVYMARAVQRVDPIKLLVYQSAIGSACFVLASLWWEGDQPTRYTATLAASLLYQGVVIAGFNFAVNAWLLQVYRPSALVACQLTTPIWGVLVSALVVGDALTPGLIVSSVLVTAGVILASRR